MAGGQLRIDWTFTCDYALVDVNSKISILGIFDRLWAGNFPGMHPSIFVVAGWLGQPQQAFTTEIRLWTPSKELAVSAQQEIQLGPDGRSTGLFQIAPLPLPSPGEYIIEFIVGAESMKHHRFTATPVGTDG